MTRTLRRVLTSIAAALAAFLAADSATASDNPVMDADILNVALQWEHIKFAVSDSAEQLKEIDALALGAHRLVEKYPDRVEPVIWQGIVTSEEAGMASTLKALHYAKAARDILEQAYRKSPTALDAGAPTSLGVLYYRVPGFPIGFGDRKKARTLLQQAVAAAPNGLDANYFYGDFLMSQHEYAAAKTVLQHALSISPHPDRPLWDKNRRIVITQMLAKIDRIDN